MKNYSANEIRNIAILGHSGSGKTTITEAALFYSGATKRFGKVDEGNTTSDFDAEEIRRKVSINTTVLPVEWKNTKINFIDTPGYFDFVGEVKSAISVSDANLIVVSAKSGVEVGAEKAWEYSDQSARPRFVFINAMDDENADFHKVVDEMKEQFGTGITPIQIPFNGADGKFAGVVDLIENKAYNVSSGKLAECPIPDDIADDIEMARAELIESAAENDEELLEKFFNDEELTPEEIFKGLEEGFVNAAMCPVFCGAASLGQGIDVLLDSILKYIPSTNVCRPEIEASKPDSEDKVVCKCDESAPFAAFVFKTISDPYVGRLNIFKVVSGVLGKDSNVYNPKKDVTEKVAHVYVVRGKEQIEVDSLKAGDIGALAKLSNTSTNDTLCAKENPVILPEIKFPESVFSQAIVPKGKGDEDKISSALTKLREEDPTILLEVNKETKQSLVYGVGEMHLDVLVSKLKSKYKIEVELVEPIIPFREMIKSKVEQRGKYKKQSGGHGQFGDVLMVFEPSGDNTQQYVFEEQIFGGSVPKQYFPAVEKGLQECVQNGVLAGYPVVGLKATLIDGSYHPVDSSEMAFKMATSVAFKEGLAKAKPTILEPIAHVEVLVPERYMGYIMGDINKRRGRILSMDSDSTGKKKLVVAEVPVLEMYKYCTDLRSMTQSRGEYTYYVERYDEAPMDVQNKIIEKRKAEKEAEK